MGWAGLSEDTEGTVGTGAVEVSVCEGFWLPVLVCRASLWTW